MLVPAYRSIAAFENSCPVAITVFSAGKDDGPILIAPTLPGDPLETSTTQRMYSGIELRDRPAQTLTPGNSSMEQTGEIKQQQRI